MMKKLMLGNEAVCNAVLNEAGVSQLFPHIPAHRVPRLQKI